MSVDDDDDGSTFQYIGRLVWKSVYEIFNIFRAGENMVSKQTDEA